MTTTAPSPTGGESLTAPDADVLRNILDDTAQPVPPGPLAHSLTFGWRAMLKIKHVPEQLFDVTAFPIMFTLMFTYLFGGALAGSTREYIQTLLPGILVMTVAMITMYTGMTLNTDIQKGVFDRFRSMPIWRPAVIVGALLGDLARYSMASVVVIVLGVAIGFRPDGGPLGVLAAVVLLLAFAFSLSWIWTSIGLRMKTPEGVMQMSMVILFPLTFVSNVFVEPETMPGWLQGVVAVNPITHLTTASRDLMHGNGANGEVLWVLIACVGMVVVFAPLTMRLFAKER